MAFHISLVNIEYDSYDYDVVNSGYDVGIVLVLCCDCVDTYVLQKKLVKHSLLYEQFSTRGYNIITMTQVMKLIISKLQLTFSS